MKSIDFPFNNFDEFLERQSDRFGNNPCLTDGETGMVYSYADLNVSVDKTAAFLRELGVKRGDSFATLTRNCPEFFLLYLASLKLGTLIIPLVVDLPITALSESLNRFRVRVLFYGAEAEMNAEKAAGACASPMNILLIDSLPRLISSKTVQKSLYKGVTLDEPSCIYFSSGTTGQPKGIPHTARNLLSASYSLAETYGFSEKDTQMGILPCYHTALAMYGFWPSLWLGSNFVLFDRFHKSAFWRNIEQHRIAFVEVVPTILAMLLNPPDDISARDISSLKFIGCGSAPLPSILQKRFEDTFNVLVAVQYGLSEAAPTHFNPPNPEERKEGSIGKPISVCEVRVVDENRNEVAHGVVGEIAMRGDNVIKGYYNDPKETAAVFDRGWFYTGDLGHRDSDGFYYISGRKKEMINRGGAKITPPMVDNVLVGLPGVHEAACVGVPNEIYGEEIVAFVVRNESKVSEADILSHCKKFLTPAQCPKEVFFIDEIPKTPSGKIMRRLLRERYTESVHSPEQKHT